MILISASPSPFARKVRIAMIEKGIAFTLQNEVPWHANTQTPRYNPLEQLPILIPDDGDPVFESTYLMDWLEHRYPEPSMLPADPALAMEAKLVHTIAEGVADATVLLFWEMQRANKSAPNGLSASSARSKAASPTLTAASATGNLWWATGSVWPI